MRMKLCLFIIQYITLGHQFYYIRMEPLLGPGVRIARDNEFPYVVSIVRITYSPYNNNMFITHICTGTLVTRKDVATVESCILDQMEMRISIGSNDYRRGAMHTMEWWTTYDHWAVFNGVAIDFEVNDIAHIRLLESVPTRLFPLALYTGINYNLYGDRAFMVGWHEQNVTIIEPLLKSGFMTIMSNRECIRTVARLIRTQVTLDKREALCSFSDPFALIGTGSRGGPLIFNNELIGINKGTVPNNLFQNDPRLINLHVAMEYYRTFIEDNMMS